MPSEPLAQQERTRESPTIDNTPEPNVSASHQPSSSAFTPVVPWGTIVEGIQPIAERNPPIEASYNFGQFLSANSSAGKGIGIAEIDTQSYKGTWTRFCVWFG